MSKLEDIKDKIESVVGPCVAKDEYCLVELDVHLVKKDVIIQILADRPMGGITIDECSKLNKKIIEEIESKNILEMNYTVEVSSPGLDRPLRTPNDFLRVLNKNVHVVLAEAINDEREVTGLLKKVEGQSIVVNREAEEIIIPIDKVEEGMQII